MTGVGCVATRAALATCSLGLAVVSAADPPASPAPASPTTAALAIEVQVERSLLDEDLGRYRAIGRSRAPGLARLGELYAALDRALASAEPGARERAATLLEQIDAAEAEGEHTRAAERELVERILGRMRRITLLEQQIASIDTSSEPEPGSLTGPWDVVLLPFSTTRQLHAAPDRRDRQRHLRARGRVQREPAGHARQPQGVPRADRLQAGTIDGVRGLSLAGRPDDPRRLAQLRARRARRGDRAVVGDAALTASSATTGGARMPYELHLALRYLRFHRGRTFLSVITLISVAGVTVGTAALVIALALMTRLRAKTCGSGSSAASAHLTVVHAAGQSEFDDARALIERIVEAPGVRAAAPVAVRAGDARAEPGSTTPRSPRCTGSTRDARARDG